MDHKKVGAEVRVTCRLSPNFSKVGWCYHCFSGRQSKGLRGSPDSVLYQLFFVERESWISPPRKLTVRFWSIISHSLCVLDRTSGPCRFCSAQKVGNYLIYRLASRYFKICAVFKHLISSI